MIRLQLTIALLFFHTFITAQFNIVPQPQSVVLKAGIFEWTEDMEIVSKTACMNEARFFADWLGEATKRPFQVVAAETWQYSKPFILFSSENAQSKEAMKGQVSEKYMELLEQMPQSSYTIAITERGVTVTASDPAGILYAVQSLRQMFTAGAFDRSLRLPYQMPCVLIKDQPRFPHRGMLLDCCRHFMTVDFVKRYIDLLSFYKMNVLHWHLTEDQGWRIQIDRYPQLTEVGAWRINADGQRYGGYYTKEQIRDVVAYAQKRHVTIIPEIEMPGHSVAAIASYPYLSCTKEKIEVENEWGVFKDIYCAGNDSTFVFLQHVLDEVCELFPGPYIHIGGDEAPKFRWENCDKCQARIKDEKLKDEAQLQTYFIERIAAYLETKGKKIIGWDEILEGGIPASAAIQSWRGVEGGLEAARHGHNVVMSPTSHCYFDYGLQSIDLEKVYAFDPIPAGLESEFKRYIIGAECNMWTEHAPQEKVDDRMFPRMPALAEVLWSYNPNRQFVEFERRLKYHYSIWDRMNIRYGFAKTPVQFNTRVENSSVVVDIQPNPTDLKLSYRLNEEKNERKVESAIRMESSGSIRVVAASPSGAKMEQPFILEVAVHQAIGKQPQLNYVPSKYYTGGGEQALTDGVKGSNNFRDGHWQAQSGQDLQATIDFGKEIAFTRAGSHFFHYANAWIFRPEELIIEYSNDGDAWKVWQEIPAPVEPAAKGELVLDYTAKSAQSTSARYIRFTARTLGPCPQWHDAVGEPSWIFWDEIVVE